MKIDHRDASGQIELEYHSEESASSHRDQWHHSDLFGKGKLVELEIKSCDHVASKGTSDSSGERYSIPVKDLIELIKIHGKRLPRRRVPQPK